MYSGLVLLANKEIKFQKDIILQSQSGKLCEWNKNDIMKNIIQINKMKEDKLIDYKKNSYNFCMNNLSYDQYVNFFIKEHMN